MDTIDILTTLGLKDNEINELLKQVYDTPNDLKNIYSEEREILLNQNNHRKQIQEYLKNFPELKLDDNDITCDTIETIYAKIMFLVSIGLQINNQSQKYITLDEEQFYHTFGITYEELTKLYPYHEYTKNIKSK